MTNLAFYPPVAVILSALILVLLHRLNHLEWDSALLFALIFILGLYFIQYYIAQYFNFLKVNQSSADHIPAVKMFRSGIGLVSAFTGFGVVFLVLASNMNWLRNILNLLKSGLLSLLRKFFSLFPTDVAPAVEETAQYIVEEEAGDIPVMVTQEKPFFFWTVLEHFLEVMFLIIMGIAICWGIWQIVLFIRSRWQTRSVSEEISDETMTEIREKCDIVSGDGFHVSTFLKQFTPSERIRKLYRKTIETEKQRIDTPEYLTADEHGTILLKREMSSIYNEARYSQHLCTNEDVKAMKEAVK